MRTIRSLLWVGSGYGLSQSGMTEAPELDITWVPNLEEALLLPTVRFDGVLLEADKPGGAANSLELLERFATRDAILVCLTQGAGDGAESFVSAGAGAVLVIDPSEPGTGFVSEINETLDAVHDRRQSSAQNAQLPRAISATLPGPSSPGNAPTESSEQEETPRVISTSSAMKEVSRLVNLAASSPSTVLITGETGVGKEVIAQELHERAARGEEAFVAINCAAFPESLLESELFGHAKGAFTGADRAKVGLFEAAGHGTLFMDEIAEMGLPLQAKLLRVLQEREIRPVGDTSTRRIHCRIIAATNRLLVDEVECGHFREDLFYRLNVFPIRIPPLRERRRDILPLARHFLALHGPREGKLGCHLSLATTHLLEGYTWPGNVRELENEILRTLMLTPSGQLITPKNLSPKLVEILEPVAHGARPDESLREALERVEAWMIRRALANNNGRKTRTAQKLGLTREGLYKKMKRLSVE
jgi:transcriptional regulator with PAS, ATPase and Fis domain